MVWVCRIVSPAIRISYRVDKWRISIGVEQVIVLLNNTAFLYSALTQRRLSGSDAGNEGKDAASEPFVYEYNQDYIDRRYEVMTLNIVHRRRRTGFEETKEFPIRTNDLIAGRYQVSLLHMPEDLACLGSLPIHTRS